MKYAEVVEIERALQRLGQERLSNWYDVAKNIRIAGKVTKEVADLVREAQKRFAKKDEMGEVVFEPAGGELMRPVFATTEDKKAFHEVIKQIDEEERKVSFHKFPMSRLKDLNLPANVMAPLLDVVVTVDEVKEEVKERKK